MNTLPSTKTALLRALHPGESATARFETPSDLNTMSSLLHQFNRAEAKPKGYRITARYDYETLTVRLEAISLEAQVSPPILDPDQLLRPATIPKPLTRPEP